MSTELDVFLSHNSRDNPAVEAIGASLKARGLSVWLDTWELRPGFRWQQELSKAIERSRAVAVFVGESGLGPWEEPEMESFLDRAMREEELPVIPVLLPGAPRDVELPRFLKLYTWVDLRAGVSEEGLDRLVWGVTGAKQGAEGLGHGENAAATQPADQPRGWNRAGSRRPLQSQCDGQDLESRSHVSEDERPAEARRWRRRGLRWGAALAVAGLVATAAAWLWPRTPPGAVPLPALYALRVQALDPEGRPAAVSAVRASAGNEPQRLPDGWWEVEISTAKLPKNRTVTVWLESEEWKAGRLDLTLGEDPNPRAEIRLQRAESWLRGVVVDPAGRAVAGARVTTRESSGAAAETDADGWFVLRLAIPRETRLRLRTERAGFAPADTFCYVGRGRCAIELRPL